MAHDPENPFAPYPKRQLNAWLTSLRGFAVLATALAVLTIVQSRTREWLLHRWADGITDLSFDQQVERLHQIASLGDLGTQTLISRMLANDPEVAQVAFELLQRQHDEWASRDDEAMTRMHSQMLVGMGRIVDALPSSRSAWITRILNDSLMEFADQRSDSARVAYTQANELLAKLAAKDRGHASPGSQSEPPVARAPSLVPLPVRLRSAPSDSDDLTSGRPFGSNNGPVSRKNPVFVGHEPPGQTSILVAQLAANQECTPAKSPTRNPNDEHRTPLPLHSWNTRSVIALLSSRQTVERDRATEELSQRGLSEEEIRIASQLAAPQTEVRLGLLDSITVRSDIDPRPWLLWLAEDPDRDLRSRAIDALSRVDDEVIRASLRKRLLTEADPEISERIRQIVDRTRLADSNAH